LGPVFQEVPAFLAENKYQDITDNTKTVLQKVHKTDLPAFTWYQQQESFKYFQQYLMISREGQPDWLSSFPMKQEIRSWSNAGPEKVLFVDIGGGFGHQCIGLRAKYPELPGRVILQDIPQTLEHVQPSPGVEVMAQDFWQPQAIKGMSPVQPPFSHPLLPHPVTLSPLH